MKRYENEEEIKNDIFNIYLKCRNESSQDRRQTYFGQLYEIIIKWCKDYIFRDKKPDPEEFGLEIFKSLHNMIKSDNQNIQKDRKQFFNYLLMCLHNARRGYKRKLKRSNREITNYDNDAKTDNTPLDTIISSENIYIIKDAILTVLDKKQDRSRDCYRALFTLDCKGLESLYPILDNEIVSTFQEGKKPLKQYEIYLKYHPTTQKNAAEAMASKLLKDFKKDLKTYLKENNPEIFS